MWNIKRYNKLCSKKFEDLHILLGKLDPVQPGMTCFFFTNVIAFFRAGC